MSLEELLVAAVRRGSLADVEGIVDTDKVDINATDRWGLTPLMEAVCHNEVEIIRFLLEHGADPMLKTTSGTTALGLAGAEARAAIERWMRRRARLSS